MDPPDSKVKVAPGGKNTRSHTAEDPDYKYPSSRTIQVYFYRTKAAALHTTTLRNYANKAQSMLSSHRVDLRAHPGLPGVLGEGDLVIDWDETITLNDHKEQLMDLSQKLKATPSDALPVILATIKDGIADSGEKIAYKGRPYVFIYGNNVSADGVTLLHEIGHAADARFHPPWGLARTDKRYSFMATPAEFKAGSAELAQTKDPAYFRNTIFRPDLKKLAEAPFAVATISTALAPLAGFGR